MSETVVDPLISAFLEYSKTYEVIVPAGAVQEIVAPEVVTLLAAKLVGASGIVEKLIEPAVLELLLTSCIPAPLVTVYSVEEVRLMSGLITTESSPSETVKTGDPQEGLQVILSAVKVASFIISEKTRVILPVKEYPLEPLVGVELTRIGLAVSPKAKVFSPMALLAESLILPDVPRF